MNKTDLINEIAAKANLNKVDAKAALNATLESIAQALVNDDKVQLIGFGTFSMQEKPERTGINPRTKEQIKIPARKVCKFKPADTLGK
ncbi:MAG: HU family DNA-binding protein [Muribaculaceae bacterium]|nr:HU family DNA-binding protein [Muribaculaceae bacterium]